MRSLRELGVSLEAYAMYQTALVVVGSLQPAHVSLWLREPVGGTQEGTSHDGGVTRGYRPEVGSQTGGGEP